MDDNLQEPIIHKKEEEGSKKRLGLALARLRNWDVCSLVWAILKMCVLIALLWPLNAEFSFLGLWLACSLGLYMLWAGFVIWRLRKFLLSTFISYLDEQLQADSGMARKRGKL
jgi:hypothetical protein